MRLASPLSDGVGGGETNTKDHEIWRTTVNEKNESYDGDRDKAGNNSPICGD